MDCGITAVDEVRYAKECGMDVIVTDHHECKEELPEAYCILNPKQSDCPYPVSYTHLDVYKRQVQYAPQGGAFLMAISLFTGIILIRGNPMRIFYSVLVVINIQNCAILLAKMLTRNGWTLIGGGQSEANSLLLSAIISFCFIPYLWLLAVKLLKPLIETRIKFAFWNYLWLVPMGFSILFNLYLYPNLLAKQMP